MRDAADRSDKVEMCMAAKAQCMKTGVDVASIAAGITPAWQGRRGPPRPNDPAAWGYAARSPAAGKIWRTTPPSRADTSAARPRFSAQIAPANSSRAVEPFSFRPDKILPGTLHHSGIRPAPPSDHTPLARRSAFLRARQRAGNSKARAGLKRLQGNFCRAGARPRCLSAHEPWNFEIPLPLCRGTGNFHESQRRRIYAHEVGKPGLLEVAIG